MINSFLGTKFKTTQDQLKYLNNKNNIQKIPKLPKTHNGEFLINNKSKKQSDTLLYRRRYFFLANPKYKDINVQKFQTINQLLTFISRAPFNGEENDNRPLYYGKI